MEWIIGPRVKCDFVGYSGLNCSGARYVARIFPTGSRKGTFRTAELKSLVIVGPVGIRVTLQTSLDSDWERHPWRCVRLTAEHRFKNDEGNEGVRIPDLDWWDPAAARKVADGRQESFPFAATLAEGLADKAKWTFGRPGRIGGAVLGFRVERDE